MTLEQLKNELKEKEEELLKWDIQYIGTRFTEILEAEISALKKGISACEEKDKEEIKFIEYLERQIIGSGEKIYTEWLKQELSIKKTKLKGNLGEIFL